MRIDQFVPTFAAGDAIGMHAQRLERVLREAGYESDIYADDIHAGMRGKARHHREYTPGDWILFHASTSSPMTELARECGVPVIVDYHNITPAEFFQRWEPRAAESMRNARVDLRRLQPVSRFGIADSSFNEAELVAEGFAPTAVAPILIDFDDYRVEPNPRMLERLRRRSTGTHWLFVGRMAPNKCQHDLVAAFAAYRRLHDPAARLSLVGGKTAILYWKAVESMVDELGVGDAVDLADSITFPELLAYYRTADVFVCTSEHEGFNVPVLEAMSFDVPVVAFSSSALPETVGDAGILLPDKDPVLVATAVDRVMTDDALRTQLVEAGRRRVDHFSLPNTSQVMLDAVKRATDG
jgi:glycosyltransferase involved in cell wall biosynthesis